MAQLIFTIPDAGMLRVGDAFAAKYGYAATLPDGSSNPQTKAQFAKSTIRDFILRTVKAYESEVAVRTAVEASDQKVEQEVSIT